jgi:chemotaxis protein MotB
VKESWEDAMNRRYALLAPVALALALSGCATNRLGGLANDLRNALVGSPVDVTQLQDSVVVTSSSDYMFPSGGWQIPSDSPVLNKIAPILSRLKNTHIVVRGYTDNVPIGAQLRNAGIADNVALSTRRAESVRNYLASHGVNPNLLSSQGFGEANPVVSNDTEQGRARNRRVDIVLMGDGT